ncbi:hypothetical protein JXA05_01075 [Candidatus Peregrinibacteria bacterium]|nr:hypothetical protein [Candidatus Peregrinibacteria bacterium]
MKHSPPFYRRFALVLIALAFGATAVAGWFLVGHFMAKGNPPLRLAVDFWSGNFWVIVVADEGVFQHDYTKVDISPDFSGDRMPEPYFYPLCSVVSYG